MPGQLRRSPEFRRFFVAHATSRAGDAFNTVALVVLVYRLTDSGIGVAATVGFEVLPVLLLGPVAGLLADRFPRRRVMIAADLLRAVAAAALAVSHTSVGLAFAVAFLLSTGAVIFNPASSSLVPDLVEPDELVDANASLWTVAVAAQVLLAPLAGGLIAVLGIGIAFWVNSASFLLSALVLLTMKAGRSPASLVIRGWRGVLDGVDAVRGHPLLARLALVQVLASLSAGATGGLLVVLAEERFDVGPSGFGLLLAAIGIGAATGPTLFRRWIAPSDRRWLFGPFAVRAAVDLVLAVVRVPLIGGAALAVYGMSTSTGMVAYQSTLQREVAPELRGRAFALYDVLWNGARLLSLGLGGILAEALGVQAVYLLGGALLLAAAAVGMTTPLRSRPESVPVRPSTPDTAEPTSGIVVPLTDMEQPAITVAPPTWSTWPQAVRVVCHGSHLRRTVTIALVVGTLLFCINQLDVVLRGEATTAVWVKSAVTYLVPFAVSNMGVLVGSRREAT